jgi:hypothetical protein
MRNLLLVLACMTALTAGSARADEASHRKSAMELFQQMDMAKVLNASMEASLKVQVQSNPAIARYEPQLRAFFAKYMSWESIQEDFAKLYMKAFSEAEMKQLVAFYKTPVGKKALSEMPSLMQQGAELGMERVQAHMGELQAMLQDPPAATPTKPSSSPASKPASGAAKPAK